MISVALALPILLSPQVAPCEVFVGTSVGGSTDPYFLSDPQTFALSHSGGNTFSDNVTSAVYTNGGLELYVGSSINSSINRADRSTSVPTWSTVTTFSGGGAYGLTLDEARDRLWCVTDPSGAGTELVAVDVDNASGTYGTVVAQTSGLGAAGFVERWGLSPDGNQAAVLQVFGNALYLWDLDPASATYLQQTGTLLVPSSVSSAFILNVHVRYTGDGKQLLVLIQHAGAVPAEVARYDFGTSAWIDHDPATSVVDNIGAMSSPAVNFGSAPACIDVAAQAGDFAVLSGFGGSGWAGRLDFDTANPATFGFTPVGAATAEAWGCGLAADESAFAVTTEGPPALKYFDATTLAYLGETPLPGADNIYTVEWSPACTGATVYCVAKVNSLGCTPRIAATGSSSASSTSGFSVECDQVRNNKSGLLFYTVNGSRASVPFQGGTLCVGPTGIKRTPARSAGGNAPPANDCSGHYALDMNAFAAGMAGGNPEPALAVAGTVVHGQWWGRDQGFPAPMNTMLSDGIEYDVGM